MTSSDRHGVAAGGGERPVLRRLMPADVPSAQRWVQAAGWNQTPADWLRLLDHQPDGCFAAELDGRPVGSVTTTRYGTELAWIGMMLVDPDYRRRGVATALMRHSVAFLRTAGVGCIQLDATDQGRPVYEPLGFRAQWEFHRWQRSSAMPPGVIEPLPRPICCVSLDAAAFGADRMPWLRRLAQESVVISETGGFGMMRPGRLASYLGPITASDSETAARIVAALVRATPGPIFWDIPGPQRDAQQIARRLGFEPVRLLLRMALGQPTPPPHIELQYALADPATG